MAAAANDARVYHAKTSVVHILKNDVPLLVIEDTWPAKLVALLAINLVVGARLAMEETFLGAVLPTRIASDGPI